MQYTRESGTRFDLNFRNLGKELNRVNFDISDNIVSLYIFYKIKIYISYLFLVYIIYWNIEKLFLIV